MAMTCPKCGKAMIKGKLDGMGSAFEQFGSWIEGRPKHSVRVQIDTYRCTDCGYLETYARKTKIGPNEKTFSTAIFKQGGF